MQEGACLPLFVFPSRQFLQPQLRHEERASFYVRDRAVEATRKEETARLRSAITQRAEELEVNRHEIVERSVSRSSIRLRIVPRR